jgi:hypothetical protein
MRLLKMETPSGAPPSPSRRISKIENGRRSSGAPLNWGPPEVLIITNWPGRAAAAMSGAASERTL